MHKDVAELSRSKHEQEWLFCACAMASPDIAVKECSWMPGSVFTDEALGDFWDDVKKNGDGIKAANDHGITTELVKWVNKTPNVTTPNVYASGIAEHKYFMDVLNGNSKIAQAALKKDKERVKRLLGELQTSDVRKPISLNIGATLDKELVDVLDGKVSPYVKTYIPTVDNSLGGFYGGDLLVFAARPGMGKTAFVTVCARNMAFSGKKVDFFSLEMSRMQLWGRMICGYAGYEWKDVRVGNVDDIGKNKIKRLSEKVQMRAGKNFIVHDDLFTVSEIVQACNDDKPDFVVIDHLGEIMWDNPDDSEVRWYGEAVKLFRTYIAKRLNIPVAVVHQLSREVDTRPNKRPILKDLRWSGEIEQRADVVGFLYREDYYMEGEKSSVVPCELIIRKNRQGVANTTVMMEYDLKKQDFKSWVGGTYK